MNSDPNSDSKQCPKSKTGSSAQCTHPWTLAGHRPWARREHTAPWPCAQRCVMARTGQYRDRARPCRSAHWPCRNAAVSSPPPVTIKKTVSRPNSCRAPCRACCHACRSVPVPCRRALLRRIAALLHLIETPNGRP